MYRLRSLAAAAAVLTLGTGVSTVTASAASAQVGIVRADQASQTTHGPRIVARPSALMVNRYTVLTGTGFKPRTRLTIEECSRKSWIVPMRVCNHRNALLVRTSAGGRFRARFKVLLCPLSRLTPTAALRRTCWVGVPKIEGIDVVTLRGAAKIVVTRP